jgi:hypothetical protein
MCFVRRMTLSSTLLCHSCSGVRLNTFILRPIAGPLYKLQMMSERDRTLHGIRTGKVNWLGLAITIGPMQLRQCMQIYSQQLHTRQHRKTQAPTKYTHDPQHVQKKKNSVALSQWANYTDWVTATCRRNLVPTFVDRGVSHGQCSRYPRVDNLSFLDRSCYFSFK